MLYSRQILRMTAGLTKVFQWGPMDLARPHQWPLWGRLRLLLLSALVRYAISQNPRRWSYHYLVWLPLLVLPWAVDGFDGERTTPTGLASLPHRVRAAHPDRRLLSRCRQRLSARPRPAALAKLRRPAPRNDAAGLKISGRPWHGRGFKSWELLSSNRR